MQNMIIFAITNDQGQDYFEIDLPKTAGFEQSEVFVLDDRLFVPQEQVKFLYKAFKECLEIRRLQRLPKVKDLNPKAIN